jgi:sigma-B regulation protein RsbU (phosphoserine phosphatase)
VIRLSRDSLGIVIGDVAGKGVPAALFMALTRSLLRAEARPGAAPESALQRVNHHLLGMNAKGLFVTVLYGILQRETGEFLYARAGHEPPILWDDQGTVLPVERERVLGLLPAYHRTQSSDHSEAVCVISDGAEASNERRVGRPPDASIPTPQMPTQAKLHRLLHILDDFVPHKPMTP